MENAYKTTSTKIVLKKKEEHLKNYTNIGKNKQQNVKRNFHKKRKNWKKYCRARSTGFLEGSN